MPANIYDVLDLVGVPPDVNGEYLLAIDWRFPIDAWCTERGWPMWFRQSLCRRRISRDLWPSDVRRMLCVALPSSVVELMDIQIFWTF